MKTYVDKAINYKKYVDLLDSLMAEGKTTGPNQSPDYLNYAKLNLARIHRLNKTATLTEELKEVLKKVKLPFIFLVLTEGWCGDAAQNIPTLHLIEEECKKIELKLILRDENLELMDRYLTNGGRSIPKLICLEKESLKEVFTWGPRPEAVQQTVLELKEKQVSLMEKAEIVHKWYSLDKTFSLQKELKELIEKHLT
ncbi:MAG: thioredoxin family protein [Bacteroidia bacterium]|nr:thioredoxin family protein [Bacteroidia bacterium]